jgi:hypothetical protein
MKNYQEIIKNDFEEEEITIISYLANAFGFNTYDDEVESILVSWAIETCRAIASKTTFEYIKTDEGKFSYLTIMQMPFFSSITEWGCSIRGAWFCWAEHSSVNWYLISANVKDDDDLNGFILAMISLYDSGFKPLEPTQALYDEILTIKIKTITLNEVNKMINWILGTFVHKTDDKSHVAIKTYGGMSVVGYKCSKCDYRWYEKRKFSEQPMSRPAPPSIPIQPIEVPILNPRQITDLELRERVVELEKIVKTLTNSILTMKKSDDEAWLKHFNEIS